MSISSARAEPGNLARMRLVLSTGHARRGWIAWCALVVAALLAGAGASHYFGHFYGNYYGNDYGHTWRAQPGALQQPAGASQDVQPLQHALEQARLQMRVAEGHSHELERQVDALNQRLRESQEELTFFRKTRDARR